MKFSKVYGFFSVDAISKVKVSYPLETNPLTERIGDDIASIKHESLNRRQRLLLEKLARLKESYDLENRVEEQMRMEALITKTRLALSNIEDELALI